MQKVKSRQRFWFVLVIPMGLLLVLAAGLYAYRASGPWPLPLGGAEARVAVPVTLAISENYIGSGLVYLAQERGYFAGEGLEVTLQRHFSGRDALKAVHEGLADLGTTGDVPLMFAVLSEWPVRNVASIFSAGGAHGIVARRDRGIENPAQLADHRVGVTLQTDSDYVLSVILADQGLDRDVVESVPLRPEAMVDALARGDVSAVATWEPWLGLAAQRISDDAVVFYPESGFRFDFSLSAQAMWIAENPETLRKVLRALLRAADWSAQSPQVARERIVAATNSNPDIFAEGRPDYRFQVELGQGQLIMLENLGRWALRHGLAERTAMPNLLDFVHMDALFELRPYAVTIVR